MIKHILFEFIQTDVCFEFENDLVSKMPSRMLQKLLVIDSEYKKTAFDVLF
jgi:hypothetical protein